MFGAVQKRRLWNRYPNSKFIWEVNCKNGKIKNPSASFSDFCTEEEILNTVGSGKNIFKLNQLIWENRKKNNKYDQHKSISIITFYSFTCSYEYGM